MNRNPDNGVFVIKQEQCTFYDLRSIISLMIFNNTRGVVMTDMIVEKTQRVLFPEKELTNWAEASYKDPNDAYAQELRRAHLKTIRRRNVKGTEKIKLIMFIQLQRLRDDSPEDWEVLNKLYQKVVKWLENKRGT